LDRLGRLAWANPFTIEALAGPVDVFHGFNYLLPAQHGRAALLVTVHDLSTLLHPEWHPTERSLVHRVALRRTVRAMSHVVTDTEAIRAEVIRYLGVSPGQVTTIHPASPPGFHPRRPAELKPTLDGWGLSPGEYLLFAGALEPRKNLVRLMEAIETLQQHRSDLPPMVLVGPPGWRDREIRNRLAAVGPHVRYLGYLPGGELAVLMAGCMAFVFPSLYEGFGLPVLEAMASGVPVVTSHGGALEEVAGDAAILVEPQDTEEIAAGIERVLDDTALRETLVRKGLARAAQFSWERAARETLRVYQRAIAFRQGL
jgi:alpha-1,3-rhamnosyl/mannosyltransferase